MTSRSEGAVLESRFWAKVDVRGNDECWEWRGMTRLGYGYMKVVNRSTRATHVLRFLATGETMSSGEEMCHLCDNPICVNPHHLYIGTNASNMSEKRQRRRAVGRQCGVPKLRGLHDELIARKRSGESLDSLAEAYGVTREAVKYHIRKERAK